MQKQDNEDKEQDSKEKKDAERKAYLKLCACSCREYED